MEEANKPKHITVREPSVTILEAELFASSPERVAQWLETRAARAKESTQDHDEELEATLLARKDPLINLALARYGIRAPTLEQLFQPAASPHTQALRVAVLTNEALTRHSIMTGGLIEALIGRQANVGQWLAGLSHSELAALFRNQSVGAAFLGDFLGGKKGWTLFDESHQLFILRMIARNPLVSTEYESVEVDGYEEYKHGAVHDAIWQLASTAPKTLPWCHTLWALFEKTVPVAHSIKLPLKVAGRWIPETAETIESGYMGPFGEVRSQIARLALGGFGSGAKKLLADDDPAIRATAYRHGDLTNEQINSAAERDAGFAFENLVRNEWLWRRRSTREILQALARAEPDPEFRMDAPNTYRHVEDAMKKEHPSWFEEQVPIDQDVLPVTRGEFNENLSSLVAKVESTLALVDKVRNVTDTILARSGWLWWGVAAVIAILIYRFY